MSRPSMNETILARAALAVALALSLSACGKKDAAAPADAPVASEKEAAPSEVRMEPAALQAARYVPTRPAGLGAVREVCEHILPNRGQ